MKILITFPTSLEAEVFLKTAPPQVEVLITGVGVASTIYQLLKKINSSHYDIIIQAGICGSFDINKFPLGSSYIVAKDVFADMGIIENNELISMHELGFFHKDEAIFEGGWLVNNSSIIDNLSLQKCNAITVNTIVENCEQSLLFVSKYKPQLESMEGAGLHYVCLLERIPFVQLRTVSNAVGERDKSKWNFRLAIDNLTDQLLKIITILSSSAVREQ